MTGRLSEQEIWSSSCEADQSAVTLTSLRHILPKIKTGPLAPCHLATRDTNKQHFRQAQVLPAAVVETVVVVLLVAVAVVASGVKRNRWTVPFGIAACISCCPGPGSIVTP